MSKLKQLFCRHEWEVCQKLGIFYSLRGEQLCKRCKKCGKVKEWIYREYEGMGYK